MDEFDFPTKNKYRGVRRRLLEKTKQKAKRLIRTFGWPEKSVKLAEHLQFCDCPSCHNPRHGNSHNDKTLQELKAELKQKD